MRKEFPVEDIVSAASRQFVTPGTQDVLLYMSGRQKFEAGDDLAAISAQCAKALLNQYPQLEQVRVPKNADYETIRGRFPQWAAQFRRSTLEVAPLSANAPRFNGKACRRAPAAPGRASTPKKYDPPAKLNNGQPFDFRKRPGQDPGKKVLRREP